MKAELEIQRRQMTLAISFLNIIETCDNKIEAGNHANYYKSVRQEAVVKYADIMSHLVGAAIEVSAQYQKSFDGRLFNALGDITNDQGSAFNF